MKKYLMTGIAALALSAGFTSCSHDVDPLTQEEINQIETQKILQNYEQAFVKHFGQPAANQTWGFGASKARTRTTINVNGNEELYENAPSLGTTEESDVTTYVRNLTTTPNELPDNLKTYFVTQVHDGEETYTNADGAGGILGSAHMNHLQIAMSEGGVINEDGSLSSTGNWMHINNFNKGDNTDWNGNTLVIDGGTYNFAYHGTEDSKYHDRWIAIDGKNIPSSDGGNYDGYYYVCFDFEGKYADGYTMIQGKWYNPDSPNGDKWDNFSNIKLPGDWTKTDWSTCNYTFDWKYTVYDSEKGENVEKTITLHVNNANEVKEIQTSNFVGGNMVIDGNNKYDDWIVRLVKATPKNSAIYEGRVMAEDLSASEGSDFDFNDVVFDWRPVTGGIEIQLVAAGGTLPLRIGDGTTWVEVHQKFGRQTTNEMINTDAGPTATAQPFTVAVSSIDDVQIEVSKDGGNTFIPLTAPQGKAASKINVDPGTPYCTEFQDIDERWSGKFSKWVAGGAEFWK